MNAAAINPLSTRSPSVLVEAHGVTVNRAGRSVLEHVDLSVSGGEIVTLIGLNGAGKSTLIRIMLGLELPDSGTVERRSGLRIGYSPQHLHRDATLPISVERFLTLGARAPRHRLEALLEEVGAGDVLDSALADISGGELHRISLARALLQDPDLLVLDEPLAGVDVAGQTELYRLIADLRDSRGCGVLLVSHDLHLVMAATDTVVCINRHVCCTGHPESVASHPEFVSLFGSHVAQVLAVYEHRHDHRHGAFDEPIPIEPELARSHADQQTRPETRDPLP